MRSHGDRRPRQCRVSITIATGSGRRGGKLPANLSTREITEPCVRRRDAIVGVHVHVRISGHDRVDQCLQRLAGKRPAQVREALSHFEGEIPERDEIEKRLAGADETAVAYPRAERAPTGRSKCLHCGEPITKGALRVAVEREVEMAGAARMGAGYLHPGCAQEYTGTADLEARLLENSKKLADADRAELRQALSGPSSEP